MFESTTKGFELKFRVDCPSTGPSLGATKLRAIMRFVVIAVLVLILASLGSALYYLVKDQGKTGKVAQMLTLRISLSVVLFAFLWFCYYMGWITPTGYTVEGP